MDYQFHIPVMKEEVRSYFSNKEGSFMIADMTLGGGGHAEYLLETLPELKILGIDRDTEALAAAKSKLARFGDRVTFVHSNFSKIQSILKRFGIEKIDGILLDLGVSLRQLTEPARGFSFRAKDSKLDMRMDTEQENTAADLLTTLSDQELASVFKKYGDQRNPKRIVRAIRKEQAEQPILTTGRLAEIISRVVPSPRSRKIHPSTLVFQSLRVKLNDEEGELKGALRNVLDILNTSARIVVLSYQSLEDRIVKNFFRDQQKGCICPPKIPVCVCGKKQTLKVITKKPATPSEAEVKRNPRASSAKLRVAERVYV